MPCTDLLFISIPIHFLILGIDIQKHTLWRTDEVIILHAVNCCNDVYKPLCFEDIINSTLQNLLRQDSIVGEDTPPTPPLPLTST